MSSLKRHLPNLVTLLRLPILGAIIWFLKNDNFSFRVGFSFLHTVTNYHIIAALYFLGAMTDILDGILARRLNAVSGLGHILDHTIDKLFILPAAYLIWRHLPHSLVFPLFLLEGGVVLLSLYLWHKGKAFSSESWPNIWGKISYGFLIGTVCVVLVAAKWPGYWPAFRSFIALPTLIIALALRVVSFGVFFLPSDQ